MLRTIFSSLGTLIGFLYPNSLASAGATSCLYLSFKRGAITSSLLDHCARLARNADLATILQNLITNPGRLSRSRLEYEHIRCINRTLALDDASGDSSLAIGSNRFAADVDTLY